MRQPLCVAEGLTQPESVIPLPRASDAELATCTTLLVPLKLSALPYRPCVDHVALVSVPPFPFPDASAVVSPEPSLNAYAATSPGSVDPGAAGRRLPRCPSSR